MTRACNMKCHFCDHWEEPENYSGKDLTTEEGIKLLRDLDKLGVGIINFGGGEPLLRKDTPLLIRSAKRLGIITGMNTNAYYLEEKAHLLKNIDYLRVSIDSTKDHDSIRGVEGAYEKAIKGIKEAQKYGIDVTIHSVVTKETFDEAENLARLAENLGCNIVFAKVFTKSSPHEKNDGKAFTGQAPSYEVSEEKFYWLIRDLQKRYSCVRNFPPFLEAVRNKSIKEPGKKCASMTITIRPDGSIVLPCDKHPRHRISSLDGWKKAVNLCKKDAHDHFCDGCAIECYLLPTLFLNPLIALKYFILTKLKK
ncbi:radical SAM protein [Candidatus Woesearchaeota archaeon]|nr:radical SAM protein [Candidatus Woesearchaeota archaeon]